MIKKKKFTNYVNMESNNVNLNYENIVAIILKLFHFSFLENC